MHCSRIELDKSYSKNCSFWLAFSRRRFVGGEVSGLGRTWSSGSAGSLVAEATAQQKMIKERQEMIDEQQEMDKKLQDMINEQQKMIDEQQKMIVEQQKMFVERQEMIDDRLERPPCLPDYFPAWLALVAPVLQE
ncbi:hypothetical protein BLNAU_8605 [Blattamonas nauphoetae]|uniref:Uncharacterized protein n=1 Tax=Blattamonas nauphoetae TaxID=2049346 RepID=A0ABQ9XY22_9EUKA|nr:hypothetical protein BLNAU_8603 [Blattamonas nauphoetae]KAK2956383.1 hypothetical protein BLNAU_8605 [Blattamonas nauphoetae]